MTILVFAEHDGKALLEHTSRAVGAAAQIGGDIHILVVGHHVQNVADDAAKLSSVSKVLLADDAVFAHLLAEEVAQLVVDLAGGYDILLAPATSNGKNIMPRVAALLDVMQISEIVAVQSADTFQRPIYAGNALQTVRSKDAKKVITVRATSFAPVALADTAPIEAVTVQSSQSLSRFVSQDMAQGDRPELASANIVVSGGRALGSSDKFNALIVALADKLDAGVGATRAAVDAGYAPNDWQIGQTGKTVAPKLYIACGVSGAIQHVAGIKDSKIIVAINKDEDAPIFKIADYGLVGDLFDIIPQLFAKL